MIGRLLRIAVAWELLWAFGIAFALHESAHWSWGAAAVTGIAAPLLVHALIVASGFSRGWRAGSPTPGRHRLGIAGAARLYLREIAGSMRAFQVEMPWMAGRALPGAVAVAPRPRAAGGDPIATADGSASSEPDALPVLLIHGYLCNRQLWRPMARSLAGRGHAIEAIDLEPPFGSIDDYAPMISAAVERLRARTGTDRIALVCHSMGGLAARAYLRAHGTAAVAHVVTLGTPHRGTVSARLGFGVNAAQMRPDSDWLKALAATESDATRALFTIVLSHHDNVVVPQARQVLPGARIVEFGGIGHVALAYDPQVRAEVCAALRNASRASVAGRPPDPR